MDFLTTTKKLCMLLLIISASLISISYAGRDIRSKSTDSLYDVNKATSLSMEKYYNEEFSTQGRVLRETTLDYGINDPTPYRDDPRSAGIPHPPSEDIQA